MRLFAFLPLKQQEVLRDEMAMGLGDGEYMIANGNCLALDAIHIVGIDDQKDPLGERSLSGFQK